jgi:zinc protease
MKRLSIYCAAVAFFVHVLSGAIAPNVTRMTVAGIDLLAYPTGVKDVVTLRASFPAGKALSPESNPALASLTAAMLDKGTSTRDKFAIAQALESVGATIQFSAGSQMLTVSAKCLKKDVPLVIALIAEQLRRPAFAPDEFAKVQKQFAGNLQRALEDTDFRASDSFTRAVYSVGHPNRQTEPKELLSSAQATTVEEVRAFHAKYFGPAQFTFVAVGDLDVPQLQAEVTRAFSGWTGGQKLPSAAKSASTDSPREQTVFMPEKTSVTVLIGQTTGLHYGDADSLPLAVGTAVLGSGFTGRLMATVRDQEGLTYSTEAFVSKNTLVDGDFEIYASFAPELLEKGLAAVRRELNAWCKDGVTATELEQRKGNVIGEFKLSLATTEGLADTLLATVHRGRPLASLDDFADRVNALTPAIVNGVIKQYLNPEKMVLIKAGTVPGAK